MSSLREALLELASGGAVVIPTDTVYGLAARPDIPAAATSLFEAKGRARTKALPVLGATLADLRRIVVFDARARRVAARFWPGPLTLVLPAAEGFDHDLGGDPGGGIAVRIPAHDLALELLSSSGPLAVTSANQSGRPPATTAAAARRALSGRVRTFLDGGRCGGSASTVVSLLDEPRLLRAGDLSFDEVRQAASR